MYYDKYGKPITREQWGDLWTGDDERRHENPFGGYRRVGWWEGEGGIEVSTVWLGLDHSLGLIGLSDGPPLIFETMIFGEPFDSDMTRYSTLEDAEKGHARTVDDICTGRPVWFLNGVELHESREEARLRGSL